MSHEMYSRIDKSLIADICNGNKKMLDFYFEIGCCEENKIVNVDFNFVTSIRYAMELNNNQTVKLLLLKVFEINSYEYKEIMMLDLPVMLK